jgi:hypothetical protein
LTVVFLARESRTIPRGGNVPVIELSFLTRLVKKHVVILGAGFGLELAARLSDALADDVRVTLLDQNASFSFG